MALFFFFNRGCAHGKDLLLKYGVFVRDVFVCSHHVLRVASLYAVALLLILIGQKIKSNTLVHLYKKKKKKACGQIASGS